MKRNRLILVLFIILTGVLGSFYGGYVSYGLFYFSLTIPVISLIYLIYVYFRFRVYQLIGHKTVAKGEHIPYQFVLSNEDILAFTNVRVSFKDDYSKVEHVASNESHCLLPGDRFEQKTMISCFYRGEYLVGADYIYVTDYLNLFQMKYQAPSPITVKVMPRIIRLENLTIATESEGKNQKYNPGVNQRVPDVEVRNFVPGDSRKMIHWKSVAKQRKLMTRKYTEEPKTEIVIFMDFRRQEIAERPRIILEDKMIETFLSISDFYHRSNTPMKIIYDNKGVSCVNVIKKVDFDLLFQLCSEVRFRAKSPMEQLMGYSNQIIHTRMFQVVITHFLTDELICACYTSVHLGNEVVVIYVGDEPTISIQDKLDSKIIFIHIPSEEDIVPILEG
jgi:hypothetical protein